ncbi:hypothetical protein F4604DRAFT_1901637 [Suillus subluteus]|nr:hypothetical protein F4604DRAFT_1901637 [Suillus subluteus]
MNPTQLPPTEKRKRGRPKGSKNGPNAGTVGRPVGRPRKDGISRNTPASLHSTSQAAEVGSHHSDTRQPVEPRTRDSELSTSTSPTPSGRESSHVDSDQSLCAPTSTSVIHDILDGELDIEPAGARNLQTRSVIDDSDQAASCNNSLKQSNNQLLCDYDDNDNDNDFFFGADAELECMIDEFSAIGDDNNNIIQDVPTTAAPDLPLPEHASSANGTKTKVLRATMPTWLADEYADARPRLDSEIAKTGRPRIPCPNCKDANWQSKRGQPVMLCVLGWPQQPQRVVDLEHLVFIIRHQYYCGHEECKKTFQSWSSAILQAIPPLLAALFPFHLTYQSGLTDRLLHIQYLETVRQRMQASASGLLPPHQPFPRWNDPSGYAGYVPTHRFFRSFYNSLIERHAVEMDQHMAMQSAETLSHDHSFKVTGILGKVNGVATFDALHTACNDYALERAFPSLLYSVNPVPSSGLEDLVVPDGWHINNRMNCLMDELRVDAEKELHVAFDLEWPVDRETGKYGRVSLVSLAYDKAIYLIPVCLMVCKTMLSFLTENHRSVNMCKITDF